MGITYSDNRTIKLGGRGGLVCSQKEDVVRVCHGERQDLCPGAWVTTSIPWYQSEHE